MTLVDMAKVIAAFTVVLSTVAALVVWALRMVIDQRIDAMEKDLYKRLHSYVPIHNCEKIRQDQNEVLRTIIRDEIQKAFKERD